MSHSRDPLSLSLPPHPPTHSARQGGRQRRPHLPLMWLIHFLLLLLLPHSSSSVLRRPHVVLYVLIPQPSSESLLRYVGNNGHFRKFNIAMKLQRNSSSFILLVASLPFWIFFFSISAGPLFSLFAFCSSPTPLFVFLLPPNQPSCMR